MTSEVFPIGSFNYTNGSSVNGSEIFGATLVLYAVDPTLGNIPIGSVDFKFTATVNDGTAVQNADYLNVEGISTSFNVLEGDSASASLYGIIDGFEPEYFQLDPGQTGGGFIGDSLPCAELCSGALDLGDDDDRLRRARLCLLPQPAQGGRRRLNSSETPMNSLDPKRRLKSRLGKIC